MLFIKGHKGGYNPSALVVDKLLWASKLKETTMKKSIKKVPLPPKLSMNYWKDLLLFKITSSKHNYM